VNILMVCMRDCTGYGHALMDAINLYTEHTARLVSYRGPDVYEYPMDIVKPSADACLELVQGAHVLNIHSAAARFLPAGLPCPPVVMTYHGTWYRSNWRALNEQAKAEGYAQTCATLDLARYGPTWVGKAVDDLTRMRKRGKRGFWVSHAPTDLRGKKKGCKGTVHVTAALTDLPGVFLDLIQRTPHAVCLQRKARTHLLIDQVGKRALGYGTNALEAWAMRMPVISYAPPPIMMYMQTILEALPFYLACEATEIRAAVSEFRDDPTFYQMWARRGYEYVKQYHDPVYIAQRFIQVCEEHVANTGGECSL